MNFGRLPSMHKLSVCPHTPSATGTNAAEIEVLKKEIAFLEESKEKESEELRNACEARVKTLQKEIERLEEAVEELEEELEAEEEEQAEEGEQAPPEEPPRTIKDIPPAPYLVEQPWWPINSSGKRSSDAYMPYSFLTRGSDALRTRKNTFLNDKQDAVHELRRLLETPYLQRRSQQRNAVALYLSTLERIARLLNKLESSQADRQIPNSAKEILDNFASRVLLNLQDLPTTKILLNVEEYAFQRWNQAMRSGYEYYRQMGVEDGRLRDEQARAMKWLLAFDEATPPKGKIRMRLTGDDGGSSETKGGGGSS